MSLLMPEILRFKVTLKTMRWSEILRIQGNAIDIEMMLFLTSEILRLKMLRCQQKYYELPYTLKDTKTESHSKKKEEISLEW